MGASTGKTKNGELRRRTPRQARSRETRAAIVEAAARLFAERGLGGTTAAQVAKLAGVSPGSMYQYFPSKEALIDAIYEREATRQFGQLGALVTELGVDDAPRLIHAFVERLVELHEEQIGLFRVLLQELPRVSGMAAMRPFDAMATQLMKAVLSSARDQIYARDLDMAALLLVRTSRYTVIALLEGELEGGQRQSFIDELSDMLATYLLLPRPWSDGKASR